MDTKERIARRLNEIAEERRTIIRELEMTSLAGDGEALRERLVELQQERIALETRRRQGS